MELWIRSQDKDGIYKVDEVYIDERDYGNNDKSFYIRDSGVQLGRYTTEARALEVLDEIQHFITLSEKISGNYEEQDLKIKSIFVANQLKIFQMPEE